MKKNQKNFCVIGLGRFGNSTVNQLSLMHKNIVAIDIQKSKIDESNIQGVEYKVLDATNINALNSIKIKSFDVVIVAIGNNIEASILTVSFLMQKKIGLLIARAKDMRHKRILKQLGVHQILTPEHNSGINAALHAVHNIPIDFQPMTKNHSIFKVQVTNPEIINQKIKNLRINKIIDFNILFIEKNNKTELASGESEIELNNGLIILVLNKYITDITNFIDPTTINESNKNNILKRLKLKKITL